MLKLIKNIITGMIAFVLLTTVAYASVGNVSVKISQPKTPTNLNAINLTVVTLDVLNRPIVVKCFKKSPTDGGFTQFGADQALPAGGTSVNCVTNSTVIPLEGTYKFYATSNAEGEEVQSDTVSIEYKLSGPDTPSYNGKDRINACEYKIKFKTADDSGKTVKIEVYRSSEMSFGADASTRVDTIAIGSNLDGSSTTTVPDCNKDYYFAIRAFDSIGNGSGVVGDSSTVVTNVTVINPTTTSQQPAVGAIPLSGQGGSILGDATASGTKKQDGSVLGDKEASPSPEMIDLTKPATLGVFLRKLITNPFVLAGVVLLIAGAFFYARPKKE